MKHFFHQVNQIFSGFCGWLMLAMMILLMIDTISRTVADKYMQTPRGIFPLRCFFTGGTETEAGEETSWDSVRARVKEIVEKEDKREPLSDDVIAARLQAEGITVSRRTIAKYRQQLHIPTARQRKQF